VLDDRVVVEQADVARRHAGDGHRPGDAFVGSSSEAPVDGAQMIDDMPTVQVEVRTAVVDDDDPGDTGRCRE